MRWVYNKAIWFPVMARPILSRVMLVVVMAISSSSVFSKRNTGYNEIIPTPAELPVDFHRREPASDNATSEGQYLSIGRGFPDQVKPGSSGQGFSDPLKNKMKEIDCSERASCQQFNSFITSPGDLILRNCFCDELCQTFDDCCRDYVRHPQSSVEILHLRPEVVVCQTLSIGFKTKLNGDDIFVLAGTWKYFVVARCPAKYSEPYIREKCELDNSADADLFYRLPVNGRTSKVLYINFYCAICNGDMDVIYWTGERDACHVDQQLGDIRNITVQGIIAQNSDCDTVFLHPDGYVPRLCKPVRRQCSANWTDRKVARKCEERLQLNSYVYHEGRSMAFRNKHCVACNHMTEAETSCIDPTQDMHFSPPFHRRLSFSILIDLNVKTLAIRNNELKQTVGSVELRECDLGSVYDPYAKICRLVFCRKGYIPTDSGCEPTPDVDDVESARKLDGIARKGSSNQTRFHAPQTNLSCSQTIRLNKSEYTVLNNQSAYVYAMNSLYTEDQYALEPPFLYICVPFNREYNATLLAMFQFDHVQSFLSFVGVIVSLMFLLIQFVIYMIFPELRNIPGKCMVCLVVSLFIGQLTFLFVAHKGPACFYLAAAMHFGFLAAFSWMNVLAFDIFRTFRITNAASLSNSGSKWKRFLAYSVYAWLTPSLIVGLCIMMDVLDVNESFRPHYGEGVCWITSQTALLMFFVVPVGVILIVNVVFFCITIYCICRSAHVAQAATPKTDAKSLLLISIKLFLIMGLTWLFGFMASLTEWTILWYAFIIFNSLQGTFLCLIFLCTMKVYRLMKTKWSTKSRNSTTSQQNKQKSTINETTVSKNDIKVVAKETCM